MFCSMTTQAQTIVRVVVDQPEKLEIIVTDDLFTEMDNSIVFGESISVNGGTEPYQYSWQRDDVVIGTDPLLTIPGPLVSGSYSLLVTDSNNCTFKVITTGNKETDAPLSGISVYPVPASRSLTIDPNDITDVLNITFYNSGGTIMLKKKISGLSVLEIDFPTGIYFIKVENNTEQLIGWRKIIVL
jgi:hypothetical protein